MSLPVKLAEIAFKLHKEGRIDKAKLVEMLEGCINLAALENGYAEEHGLPFRDPVVCPKCGAQSGDDCDGQCPMAASPHHDDLCARAFEKVPHAP